MSIPDKGFFHIFENLYPMKFDCRNEKAYFENKKSGSYVKTLNILWKEPKNCNYRQKRKTARKKLWKMSAETARKTAWENVLGKCGSNGKTIKQGKHMTFNIYKSLL